MAPNDAMLFLLPVAQQARFYMRNTLVPLSCAYMDDEGVILETHDMKPTDAPARFEDYWQWVPDQNRLSATPSGRLAVTTRWLVFG
jgi:hypothetical protein